MATKPSTQPNLWRQISTFFYLRPTLSFVLLLAPPLLWLGVVYFGRLIPWGQFK